MPEQDLWMVLGRAQLDPGFGARLAANPQAALNAENYRLDPQEWAMAQQALAAQSDWEFQRNDVRTRLAAATERGVELGRFTVDILQRTLNNAARTYKNISLMLRVMFWVGILTFLGSSIYGLISREVITFGFAGLGAATFVATFVVGPIEKSQTALSNLVQAEVAFMTFFEQITFWENYALGQPPEIPGGALRQIEKASEELEKRSKATMALLQRYLEQKEPKSA